LADNYPKLESSFWFQTANTIIRYEILQKTKLICSSYTVLISTSINRTQRSRKNEIEASQAHKD